MSFPQGDATRLDRWDTGLERPCVVVLLENRARGERPQYFALAARFEGKDGHDNICGIVGAKITISITRKMAGG